jgi:gamma-glutamyltranspeptidase / glutathione hydrolase
MGRVLLIAFCIFLFFQSCKKESYRIYITSEPQKYVIADSMAISTAHPLASKIGMEVLEMGGNAIDAAIAVQFALAVCLPTAGNIGGGGFMLYRNNNGEVFALDYRETAPENAYPHMYLDEHGEIIPMLSLEGHLSVGVPGTVDGMWQAFNKFSKLKNWKILLQPAFDLANYGFSITQQQADELNNLKEHFLKVNQAEISLTKATKWMSGDILVQKELAESLARIRDKGKDGFYKGKTADLIIEEMKKGTGLISHSDLENYKSIWRDPIVFNYKDREIYSMPPPSSGGIALAQLMGIADILNIGQYDFHSAEAIHLMVEAERIVYADRSMYLGDPDYYHVPTKKLLNSDYLLSRAAAINPLSAHKSKNIEPAKFMESEETTHYSILDKYGNAVSMTTTLNAAYGSKLMVPGAGFLLNNEMDDFSIKPGAPNLFGLVGGEANKIEPGKRMLSSITPTIVCKDGQLEIILGTPGGSTIITSVFQVVLNLIEFGLSPFEAVQAVRFHHQWLPDQIFVENAIDFPEDVLPRLENIGHDIYVRGNIGRVELIYLDSLKKIHVVADKRGDDDARGR